MTTVVVVFVLVVVLVLFGVVVARQSAENRAEASRRVAQDARADDLDPDLESRGA